MLFRALQVSSFQATQAMCLLRGSVWFLSFSYVEILCLEFRVLGFGIHVASEPRGFYPFQCFNFQLECEKGFFTFFFPDNNCYIK